MSVIVKDWTVAAFPGGQMLVLKYEIGSLGSDHVLAVSLDGQTREEAERQCLEGANDFATRKIQLATR